MRIHNDRMETRDRAFALVLSLMLVAMLATTSVGLGMLVSTETVRTRAVSRALDHRLAVDSLLAFLPDLLRGSVEQNHAVPADGAKHLSLMVGPAQIECFARPENRKTRFAGGAQDTRMVAQLHELARSNGLSEQSVVLRPIVESDETRDWPSFLWFDQLIDPMEFEQTFRWMHVDSRQRKTWSDIITFWNTSKQGLILEISTTIHVDVRRWYVVVELAGDDVRVLYRGLV